MRRTVTGNAFIVITMLLRKDQSCRESSFAEGRAAPQAAQGTKITERPERTEDGLRLDGVPVGVFAGAHPQIAVSSDAYASVRVPAVPH